MKKEMESGKNRKQNELGFSALQLVEPHSYDKAHHLFGLKTLKKKTEMKKWRDS